MSKIKSSYIKVNEEKIHYFERKESSEKKAIIFIHGAGETSTALHLIESQISQHKNTIMVDLPGHGESQGVGRNNLGDYTAFTIDFISAIQKEKQYDEFILIGHSLGACIAVNIGISKLASVKKIIAIGGSPILQVPAEMVNALENPDAFRATINSLLTSSTTDEDKKYIEEHFDELFKVDGKTIVGDFTCAEKLDILEGLKNVVVPTLIICGDKDALMSIDMQIMFAKGIANSYLNIIPNRGHMLPVEKSAVKQLGHTILEFVDNYSK